MDDSSYIGDICIQYVERVLQDYFLIKCSLKNMEEACLESKAYFHGEPSDHLVSDFTITCSCGGGFVTLCIRGIDKEFFHLKFDASSDQIFQIDFRWESSGIGTGYVSFTYLVFNNLIQKK